MMTHFQVFALLLLLIASVAGPSGAQTLTLDEAQRIARQNAPTVRLAQERVAASVARARMAEAALYPSLGVTSSYTSSDNPVQAFMFALNQGKFALSGDFNHPERADNWQLSAQAGLRLFSGGSDLANRRAARAAAAGTKELDIATRNEVSLQVLRAYLDVLTAQHAAKAAEAAVKAFEAAEQVVAVRLEVGTALRTDLLNIQVQRIQSQEQRLRATNAVELSKDALMFALGVESLPYSEFSPLDQIVMHEAEEAMQANRPEVNAGEHFAKAAKAELAASRGSYLPNINLFASADRYQGWKFDGAQSNWTVGISAQWQLFDGFLTPARVSEKRANYRIAEENARLAQLQSKLELASTLSTLREATERVAVMTQAVELASESALLTRQRFEQGLVLTSQVIDAENALMQAEVALAQAKSDRLIAIASQRRAYGLPIAGE